MKSSEHSITILLEQLGSDENLKHQRAAQDIWSRYSNDLLAIARRHLSERVRQRTDEEDVLQSMYKSFCVRHQRGEFVLEDRTDLWKLLVTITQNKAINAAVHHRRQKRDVRAERQESGKDSDGSDTPLLADLASASPSPAEAMELVEQCDHLLQKLTESQRQLALWKLQGFSNEEIAGPTMLNCAVRTVERKLSMIRNTWGQDASGTAQTSS